MNMYLFVGLRPYRQPRETHRSVKNNCLSIISTFLFFKILCLDDSCHPGNILRDLAATGSDCCSLPVILLLFLILLLWPITGRLCWSEQLCEPITDWPRQPEWFRQPIPERPCQSERFRQPIPVWLCWPITGRICWPIPVRLCWPIPGRFCWPITGFFLFNLRPRGSDCARPPASSGRDCPASYSGQHNIHVLIRLP